uniref:Enoyl-CoA hydratase n=1 Tax=Haliea sp. ETY-M TaxID=1055105 RepID=A0A455R1Q9_9GAMM|nr:enoyl-CoA hydratase [Haliea sp. ETY-M]
MYETLEIQVEGPVAHLWLNRADRLNALSVHTLQELAAAAQSLNALPDVRVVVVGGRGRAFCAGADLENFAGGDVAAGRAAAESGLAMAAAIEGLTAVSIARIQGWCVGGGLVLAAACDLRVAADAARFSIPEVALGIPLAWGGIPRLVAEIGPARTKELVMTCREFDAAEALQIGFLNTVCAEDDLDDAVATLTGRLLEMPSYPVQATKRHVNAVSAGAAGLARSWSDADSLLAGLNDPECEAARQRYLAGRS